MVFRGRDEALAALESVLSRRRPAVVTQADQGPGGVGKSELVLQHAHAHRRVYQLIWWVEAADRARIEAGLARLAERLEPVTGVALSTSQAAAWAVAWLQEHQGWLLVLDDVQDPGQVSALTAQLETGHIVMTSRRDTGWQQLADPVRLGVLAPAAAADVLTGRTGDVTPGGQDDAEAIAAEVGYLPLALDQAAAYLTQARPAAGRYLEELRSRPVPGSSAVVSQEQQTIALLWEITMKAVAGKDRDAVLLLGVLACFAPGQIPRSIVRGVGRAGQADRSLRLLASYNLITITAQTLSMHRLIQTVALGHRDAAAPWPERDIAADWLNHVVPVIPPPAASSWPVLRAIAPHAESLASRYPSGQHPAALLLVENQLGAFFHAQGDYQRAESLFQPVLEDLSSRDPLLSHADVDIQRGRVAAAYFDIAQGKQALRLAGTGPGPGDPGQTLSALDHLAGTYLRLGRIADAVPLIERMVQITETARGRQHPRVASWLGQLGAAYCQLGRPEAALPVEQRALRITERARGRRHPDTALRLANLALTYHQLGRGSDAIPLLERALQITEAARGPDDPATATSAGNLGVIYRENGRITDAVPLFERALKITEAALARVRAVLVLDQEDSHARLERMHDVDIALKNLASTYSALGRPADALPLDQRALQITEAVAGPHHPDIATALANLAITYRALGQPENAAPLEQRAEQITRVLDLEVKNT